MQDNYLAGGVNPHHHTVLRYERDK